MLFLRSHRQYVGGENKTLRTIKLFKSTQSTILKLQNITKATVFRKIQVYHRLNKMTDSQMRRFIQSESEFIWMWFIIERSLMCLLSWYIFALRVVTDSLLSSLIHHKGMRALSNCSLSPSWQWLTSCENCAIEYKWLLLQKTWNLALPHSHISSGWRRSGLW